jgi:hypothetical protein
MKALKNFQLKLPLNKIKLNSKFILYFIKGKHI